MNINVNEENVQFQFTDNFWVGYWLLKKLGASVNEENKKMESVYIAIARYSQKNDRM